MNHSKRKSSERYIGKCRRVKICQLALPDDEIRGVAQTNNQA